MKTKRLLMALALLLIFAVEDIVAADLSDGSMILNKDSYVFKGKEVTPKVAVYCDGVKLKKDTDYTLKFENNYDIGTGSVFANGIGQYSNGIKSDFLINPQKVKIKKIKFDETGIDVSWKESKYVDGYEIEYALNSYFANSVVRTIQGRQNTNIKLLNLRPNSKYFLRSRSYKVVYNKCYYSVWSKAKKYIMPFYKKDTYMIVDLSGGTNAVTYPISYMTNVPVGGWTEEYKTTKMVLRLIESGTFIMGSPEDELGREEGEIQHSVTLTKAFYAGVFEVTQKQYELVVGTNPSMYTGDARPVEQVSYDMIRGTDKGRSWPTSNDVDENTFFGKLREKTSLAFDLPTEAQWEYACRADTTTALNNGKNLSDTMQCEELDEVARYTYNTSDGKGGYAQHTTVGSYMPNNWGLYDMHGNVWEWCLDGYGDYRGDEQDPKGPTSFLYRTIRGGSHSCYGAFHCRSAFRHAYSPSFGTPSYYSNYAGFRVFLAP